MSTLLSQKENQCYNIRACRFYGGDKNGVMVRLEIGDGEQWMAIALKRADGISFCLDILKGLTEL